MHHVALSVMASLVEALEVMRVELLYLGLHKGASLSDVADVILDLAALSDLALVS